MSKRPLASSSSSPRRRKNAKPSSNQPSLDSFFKSRDATSPTTKTVSSGDVGRSGTPGATIASGSVFHDIAADEAFAGRLAEEDGIAIHMLQRMEATAKKVSQASTSKTVTKQSPEIIDVDLLEDPAQDEEVAISQPAGEDTFSPAIRSLEVSAQSPSFNTNGRDRSTTPRRNLATTVAGVTSEPPLYPPLDVDPVAYSLDSCPWRGSSAAPYSFLSHALATLSGTRSRIVIMNVLTNTLRTIIKYHSASLRPALYLLSNSLSPPYSPIELGLGHSIVTKVIQDVSGLSASALRRLYNSTGDPGE